MASKTLPEQTADGLPPWERRLLGKDTKEWVIRESDCSALLPHGLRDISHTRADPMYRGVRRSWPFLMVVVSAGGGGKVLIEGTEWVLGAGEVLVIPPGLPHDFRALEPGWVFSMLNYKPSAWEGRIPASPRSLPIHAQPLEAMIEAFYREYHADKDPVLLRQMTDIIHAKVLRLANPDQTAGRLWPLWQKVLEEPSFAWNLESLARMAHMSEEHLRRISRAEVGRSPMEQITRLRLQESARLLLAENDVVEEVAHRVGFESERAFRAAFQRAFDCSPSAYRQQGRTAYGRLSESKTVPAPSVPASISLTSHAAKRPAGVPPWVRSVKRWHSLDLSRVANAYFTLGPRPWLGESPLLGLRPGNKAIHGMIFDIRDESRGPSVLLLRSNHVREKAAGGELPGRVRIPIGRKVRGVAFLHACGWGVRPGVFASYRLVEEGGESSLLELATLGTAHPEERDGRGANIQDWYFGYDVLERGEVRPFVIPTSREPGATPQYLYTLVWHNPRPKERLDFLEIESLTDRDATLAVLAVTAF